VGVEPLKQGFGLQNLSSAFLKPIIFGWSRRHPEVPQAEADASWFSVADVRRMCAQYYGLKPRGLVKLARWLTHDERFERKEGW
jgi:hypothetical protein